MDPIYQIAQEYLALDQNETTRNELSQLVQHQNTARLTELLGSRMTFGTAGLRAEMGCGYTRMNDLTVIQATQGLCAYLMASVPDCYERGVVIGHDHRHHSEDFARLTAAVFLHKNIRVYYYNQLTHTPLVPFGIKILGAACGIMITASHNPKKDNGYKVYWGNACQIISPHDAGIANAISENLTPWIWDKQLVQSHALASDPLDMLIPKYYQQVADLKTSRDALPSSVRFCYTAMHGVGYEYAKKAFECFGIKDYVSVTEQVEPDPDFPTVEFPNPEEGKGALKLAMETAARHQARIIFANDPDGMNIAHSISISGSIGSGRTVAQVSIVFSCNSPSGDWHVFTGNELGSILGCFIWESFKKKNPSVDPHKVYMLASTVSSKMLQAVAQKEGFQFEDTLTGFKWLGNRAIDLTENGHHVLFAFEEAIGFMVGDVVRDKDGISAMAVCAECALEVYQQGSTLYNYLMQLYSRYGYFVSDNSYFICHSQPTIQSIFDKIRYSTGSASNTLAYPQHVGTFTVKDVRDLTVGYDSAQVDKKPVLPVSKSSHMITFRFTNGAVVTLRTSGTEPKAELSGKTQEEAQVELGLLVKGVVDTLLQPHENGLGYRKEE